MAEIKFEEALKKLEKIVEELEQGDLSLDEALKKYQDGIELSRLCSSRLESAKKKIDVLAKNKKGDFELKP
ncbi:MAG: exodeoxyribonuclease VII small subunit, partial [Candidatus Omnitrophota bacterium]